MKRRQFLSKLLAGASLPLAAFPAFPALAASQTYRVKKGDTLSSIAQKHGATVAALKAANRLKGDLIQIGQTLAIPGRAPSPIDPVIQATDRLRRPLNPWTMVVGHHSGIEQGNAAIYDRNHRRRGMENGLAYHFVIGNGIDSGDGQIEIGPRWTEQLHGGHTRLPAINAVGIGICLVGNFEKRRPSAKQIESFAALVDYLKTDVIRKNFHFTVHREVDPGHTVCLGRQFPTDSLRKRFA